MGKPRNTQKYPTYPEIPEIPGNTRKKKRYPEIPDRIFRHSYPTRTRPATRYFVQYPTRPDPILKNPTRWALDTVCGWYFFDVNSVHWCTKAGILKASPLNSCQCRARPNISITLNNQRHEWEAYITPFHLFLGFLTHFQKNGSILIY